MQPDSDESIERLIRPLENNAEIHLAARCYLLEKMGESGATGADLVAAFVKTREHGEPGRSEGHRAFTSAATQTPDILLTRRFPKHWRRWFYLAVTALILALAAPCAWQVYEGNRVWQSFWNPYNEPYIPRKIRNLPEKDRILLMGDESLDSGDPEKWRPLWKLEPENPVFLANYASTPGHRSVSPEILEAAARIDPDNALYPLLQATRDWNSIVESKTARTKGVKPGTTKEWIVKNAAALDERIAQIHRAVRMPAIRFYYFQLYRRQRAVMAQPLDTIEGLEPLCYQGWNLPSVYISPAANLLAAKASQCAKHGDAEGFRSAVSDWKALCQMMLRDGEGLTDILVSQSMVSSHLESFRDGAVTLGLVEEARQFDAFDKVFKDRREDRKKRSKTSNPTDELLTQKEGVLCALVIRILMDQTKNPPPITAGDLRPGRYADHALLGRVFSFAAAGILALLSGAAALCRFRQSAMIRGLSTVTPGLLRPADTLWITGLGMIAPLAWFLTIQFLTPLGAREWSPRFTALVQPCAQFGAAVLLVMAATLVTAGWRLGVRGAMFGLQGKRPWIGWLMVGILVLSIPGIGALPGWKPAQTERGLQIALAVLLGLPLLWLGVSLLLNLVNRADHSLRRATHARLMIPAWMGAAAAFACLAPVYHQSEKYWFRNERLIGMSDSGVDFSRYETEVATILRQELRELMDKHF